MSSCPFFEGTRSIGRTIVPALAAVLANSPLPAQERPAKLIGCYDITAGMPDSADGPRLKIGLGSGLESEMPPRIEFAGQFPGFADGDTLGTQIVVPEGALPSVHSLMWGEVVGDSLELVFSTGFGGVRATLGWTGDHWTGSARYRSDVTPHESDAGPIELTPVSCDSPPPVSSDAMLPITRFVELEGGLVISLGEPLPEDLETTPALGTTLTVTGRTTGLFAGADSVVVAAAEQTGVGTVFLYYTHNDAHSELETRFRSAYGDPDTGPDRRRQTFRNPITRLTLWNWGNGRAQVILSDPR